MNPCKSTVLLVFRDDKYWRLIQIYATYAGCTAYRRWPIYLYLLYDHKTHSFSQPELGSQQQHFRPSWVRDNRKRQHNNVHSRPSWFRNNMLSNIIWSCTFDALPRKLSRAHISSKTQRYEELFLNHNFLRHCL